jgi:hypothetical protein
MASADAIADLGDTLIALLKQGLGGIVEPANVKLSMLEELKGFKPHKPTVTVFLYHVAVNSEMRNGPRRVGGSGAQAARPPLPLELRFLVTPWSALPRDAHRIVGAVVQIFYDRAILHRADLAGASWEADDTVEINLESLPVEEHYDIWNSTENPYRLSLSYMARVIGIDSTAKASGAPVVSATFGKGAP